MRQLRNTDFLNRLVTHIRSVGLLTFALSPTLPGLACNSVPEPPSQKSVEEAWKRADQAVQQVVAAEASVKHIARLREIDRLRYQADANELATQIATLRGLTIGLAICLLVALLWLAREIRRRRLLSAILQALHPTGANPHANGSAELFPHV